MTYRQSLGLCPGSGENSTRLSLESGMRLYSQRQNMSVGTSTSIATNGFRKIESNSIRAV